MAQPMEQLAVRFCGDGVEFAVKVVAGAGRDRVVGLWNGALKVAVSAPAEGGRANAALVRLLAQVLGCRPQDVRIISGQRRPLKRVAIYGLTEQELRAALG
jgi:uncharacterized protein (TIGR00251 family)